MRVPEILGEGQTAKAAALLRKYYTEPVSKGRIRTGARFDTWAGGGDGPGVANTITADDMYAASFLSVPFEPAAVIGILDERRVDIAALLVRIPTELNLSRVGHDEFKEVLGEGSPAWKLWDILRGKEDGGWGIGPTRASKLMARKRPRLIPIWDSVVQEEAQVKSSLTQWADWHQALTEADRALARRLDVIQQEAKLPNHVSQLRAMDVVLWMHGNQADAPDERASEHATA